MESATKLGGCAKHISRLQLEIKNSPLIQNISKVYFGDLLSRIVGGITTLLLIRGLSVSDYAAYTAFLTVLLLFPSVVGSGVNLALVRFGAEYISRTGKRPFELYSISLTLQVLLYAVFAIVLVTFDDTAGNLLFGEKPFSQSLRFGLLAGFGFLVTQAGRSIYQAEEKFGHYIISLWIRQFSVMLLIGMLFIANLLNVNRSIYVITIAEIVVAFIVIFHVFRDFGFHSLNSVQKRSFIVPHEIVVSTGWLVVYYLLLTCFSSTDIFFLSHLSDQVELANYGVAFRYYSIGLLLLGSIHSVLRPRFAKVDMHDIARQRRFTLKWLKLSAWLLVPIILIVAFSERLFILVNGAQYQNAYGILCIFSVGIWISLVFSPLVNILVSRKSFKFLVGLALAALVVNCIGNIFLIPVLGAIGAASATIISHALVNLASGIRIFFSDR